MIRHLPAALALIMLASCATTVAPNATGSPGLEATLTATPRPTPSPTPPAPSPTPSTARPGTVTYVITGDYSATGELPFVPASSSFDQDGATSLVFCSGSCTYQDSSAFLIISFGPDEVRFENGEVLMQVVCTFTFTRQTEIGAAGEFACTPDQAFGPGSGGVCGWTAYLDGTSVISRTDTCSPIGTATISGSFDAGGS
jgi:hypothetical protein